MRGALRRHHCFWRRSWLWLHRLLRRCRRLWLRRCPWLGRRLQWRQGLSRRWGGRWQARRRCRLAAKRRALVRDGRLCGGKRGRLLVGGRHFRFRRRHGRDGLQVRRGHHARSGPPPPIRLVEPKFLRPDRAVGMAVPGTAGRMMPLMLHPATAAVGLSTAPTRSTGRHDGMVDDRATSRRRGCTGVGTEYGKHQHPRGTARPRNNQTQDGGRWRSHLKTLARNPGLHGDRRTDGCQLGGTSTVDPVGIIGLPRHDLAAISLIGRPRGAAGLSESQTAQFGAPGRTRR